jgi:hypothetical protein
MRPRLAGAAHVLPRVGAVTLAKFITDNFSCAADPRTQRRLYPRRAYVLQAGTNSMFQMPPDPAPALTQTNPSGPERTSPVPPPPLRDSSSSQVGEP